MSHIPKPKPKKVDKTKKRIHRKLTVATIDVEGAKEDSLAGHEARLEAYIKRTLELKRKNYYHHEIAETIAEEYKLERVPAITTIADWLKKGLGAVREDIEELQWQMRLDQWNDLERIKAKWMPLATAASLEIKRWQMVEGELQPTLDENAVKEQIEATKQIVAIMSRQAKLLGLDLAVAVKNEGDGPGSLQDLQLWMVGQINIQTASTGGSIDVSSEILELKSGIPEIDAV